MKHRDLLTLLLPPGSYASDGPRLAAELAADGAALDASLNQHGRIRRGITPLFAEQLLPEWERICGLSPQTDAPYLARQEAVLAIDGGMALSDGEGKTKAFGGPVFPGHGVVLRISCE